MTIATTTLETYETVKSTLSGKRRLVFACIESMGPVTAFEIAEFMGWPINSVSGRVSELKDGLHGLPIIEFAGIKMIHGRRHKAWKATRSELLF